MLLAAIACTVALAEQTSPEHVVVWDYNPAEEFNLLQNDGGFRIYARVKGTVTWWGIRDLDCLIRDYCDDLGNCVSEPDCPGSTVDGGLTGWPPRRDLGDPFGIWEIMVRAFYYGPVFEVESANSNVVEWCVGLTWP